MSDLWPFREKLLRPPLHSPRLTTQRGWESALVGEGLAEGGGGGHTRERERGREVGVCHEWRDSLRVLFPTSTSVALMLCCDSELCPNRRLQTALSYNVWPPLFSLPPFLSPCIAIYSAHCMGFPFSHFVSLPTFYMLFSQFLWALIFTVVRMLQFLTNCYFSLRTVVDEAWL